MYFFIYQMKLWFIFDEIVDLVKAVLPAVAVYSHIFTLNISVLKITYVLKRSVHWWVNKDAEMLVLSKPTVSSSPQRTSQRVVTLRMEWW